MTTIQRLLVLALVSILLAGCATSPTGRRQLMLVSEQSSIVSSKEAYLSTVKELDQAGKIEEDRAINARVNTITGRLITEAIKMRPDTANWEWSVVVIDDPEMVNAWCMAGGRMAIYTGLLEQIQPTDDELAQVMGHDRMRWQNIRLRKCRCRWPQPWELRWSGSLLTIPESHSRARP